jgi:hypothetical protein
MMKEFCNLYYKNSCVARINNDWTSIICTLHQKEVERCRARTAHGEDEK